MNRAPSSASSAQASAAARETGAPVAGTGVDGATAGHPATRSADQNVKTIAGGRTKSRLADPPARSIGNVEHAAVEFATEAIPDADRSILGIGDREPDDLSRCPVAHADANRAPLPGAGPLLDDRTF